MTYVHAVQERNTRTAAEEKHNININNYRSDVCVFTDR